MYGVSVSLSSPNCMVGDCAYYVGKAYNLCRIYKTIRIATSSILDNSYAVVSMIRLLCVDLLEYVSRCSSVFENVGWKPLNWPGAGQLKTWELAKEVILSRG
uniref:Uncharacterized protein n=1 Tax=Arundo donax TaxID=35708 RepID=A0A0A9A4M6_ARUDO